MLTLSTSRFIVNINVIKTTTLENTKKIANFSKQNILKLICISSFTQSNLLMKYLKLYLL